jgi:hypothetical protein
MTLEEEKSILEQITEDSSKGLVLIAARVQKIAEEKRGQKLFKNYAYELLERHEWRKIKPRPKNPKSSREVQEQFKKDFPAAIQKVVQTFDPLDTRPILKLTEDEARFGRISIPRVCTVDPIVKTIFSLVLRNFKNSFIFP